MKNWHHKRPEYQAALFVAESLILQGLVGNQWNADALASYLIGPMRTAARKLAAKPMRATASKQTK